MANQKLHGRREGPVAHVVFDNPARMNAVSLDMWEALIALLDEYRADPDIRCLVVSGAGGKAFVSGADISKFESERANAEMDAKYGLVSNQGYEAVYDFPKPTIAMISGYCIGGGMNLAACCDLRYCDEKARFGIPAAKLGLGYGFFRIERMSRLVGLPATMEMLFTARQYTAVEALAMGLVQGVFPDAGLEAAVAAVTGQIAANAPLTIALAKAAAREVAKPEAARDHATLEALATACFDSADYKEGRDAFMQKRKPRFTGK